MRRPPRCIPATDRSLICSFSPAALASIESIASVVEPEHAKHAAERRPAQEDDCGQQWRWAASPARAAPPPPRARRPAPTTTAAVVQLERPPAEELTRLLRGLRLAQRLAALPLPVTHADQPRACAARAAAAGGLRRRRRRQDRLRAAAGLRFPEDMKVVGFDDIPMAEWESNDLTTIRLPVQAMAKRATDVISRIVLEDETVEEKIWIPCRLIERRSA